MSDTAKIQKPVPPSIWSHHDAPRLLEKSHFDAVAESLREDSTHHSSFESKQPTQYSKFHPTTSEERKQPSSSTHKPSTSDQVSSLDVNHTKSHCSSASATLQDLTSDARLPPTSVQNDLLSISAWAYLYDSSHRQFLHPSPDGAMNSTCLDHTPMGLGSQMACHLGELVPLDRWINEVPGEGYEVAVQLRHQAVPDCSCMVIQDVIGEDIDGLPQQDAWGI